MGGGGFGKRAQRGPLLGRWAKMQHTVTHHQESLCDCCVLSGCATATVTGGALRSPQVWTGTHATARRTSVWGLAWPVRPVESVDSPRLPPLPSADSHEPRPWPPGLGRGSTDKCCVVLGAHRPASSRSRADRVAPLSCPAASRAPR